MTNNRLSTMLLLALVAGGPVRAATERLESISPGGAGRFLRVTQSCPTFSWAAPRLAAPIELEVYEVSEEAGAAGVGAALEPGADPAAGGVGIEKALHMRLPRGASSWTPSSDSCLESGVRYAWVVRAGRDGEWSEARLFEVEGADSASELERAVERVLERYLAASRIGSEEAGGFRALMAPAEPPAAAEATPGEVPASAAVAGDPTGPERRLPDSGSADRVGLTSVPCDISGASQCPEGDVVFGLLGLSHGRGAEAVGVYGHATTKEPSQASYGVLGKSEAGFGRGVEGWAEAEQGETIGVRGIAESPDGIGVLGVGSPTASSAIGVKGEASSGIGGLFIGGLADVLLDGSGLIRSTPSPLTLKATAAGAETRITTTGLHAPRYEGPVANTFIRYDTTLNKWVLQNSGEPVLPISTTTFTGTANADTLDGFDWDSVGKTLQLDPPAGSNALQANGPLSLQAGETISNEVEQVVAFTDNNAATGSRDSFEIALEPDVELRTAEDANNLTLTASQDIVLNATEGSIRLNASDTTIELNANTLVGGTLGITEEDAVISASTAVTTLTHATTGTAASGIGAGVLLRSEDDGGNLEDVARVDAVLTDAGDGSEASELRVLTRAGGGALAEVAAFDSGGLQVTGALDVTGNVTAAAFTGDVTGNSSTATALAADGTDCDPGWAPVGVDEFGAAEGCVDVATQTELEVHKLSDDHAATYVNVVGDTMAGDLGLGGNQLTEVSAVTRTGANDLTVSSGRDIVMNAPSGSIRLNASDTTIELNANTLVGGTLGITEEDAVISASTAVTTLTHATTGTAASGIGAGVLLRSEDDDGNLEDVARVDAVLTDAGDGSEASELRVLTRAGGGALAEVAAFDSGGLQVTGALDVTGNVTAAAFTGDVTGNSSTATALAADGTDCDPGWAPVGVDEFGAVEGCVDVATQAELEVHKLSDDHAATYVNVDGDTMGGFLNVGGNVTVGGVAETLANPGFSLLGDDLFVAGTAGVEGTIFTDSGLTVGASTTYADGAITQSTAGSGLTIDLAGGDAAGEDLTVTANTVTLAATSTTIGSGADGDLGAGNGLPTLEVSGQSVFNRDNATSFRLRGRCDTDGDGSDNETCESYSGVFFNPAGVFDDTGGTGARNTRVIFGSNEDMDLEIQGSNHIRITAVDNNVGNGRIRLAAEDEIQFHAGGAAESDALVATLDAAGLTVTASAVLRLTPTNSPPTCGGTEKGSLYYDDSLSALCSCNGTGWTTVSDNTTSC